MSELIAALIEAQLEQELASLRPPALTETVQTQVAALFSWLGGVKLDDVSTRAQIEGVIERYVIELRVSGGIPELSGEMAGVVLASRVSKETRVDQLLSTSSFQGFADKVVALEGVRRELIARVARSTTFSAVCAQLFGHGLLALLVPAKAANAPWAASAAELFSTLRETVAPGLQERVSDAALRFLQRHRERVAQWSEQYLLEALDPERLRSLLDELWEGIAGMQLSEAFALLGEQDIEDLIVLGYEFWQRYRKSEFFRRIVSELVDHFFRKYGQESLLALTEDMGVDQAMVTAECVALLGPMLEHAAGSGFLERQLRARLERVYASPKLRALLER